MLMCIHMLTKRTNILFSEDIWSQLVELAASKKTSVGQLIREAVEDKYDKATELSERRELLEEIERIRPHFKGRLDYKALINYGRKKY